VVIAAIIITEIEVNDYIFEMGGKNKSFHQKKRPKKQLFSIRYRF